MRRRRIRPLSSRSSSLLPLCAGLRRLVAALALALLLGGPGARAAEPLRVALSQRSMPCTFYANGQWYGSFHETWSEIAASANLPFQLESAASFRELLEAGQSGKVDVAVGCVNMTPDRLLKYRFSVPIQEDGISVLVRKESAQIWLPILQTIFSLDLLGLLGGILGFVLVISLIIWKVEGYDRQDGTRQQGRPRTFSKLFQILLTGPGTNVIASTVRGNSLIGLVYFVRIVAASVLVSFVSVNIIKRSAQDTGGAIRAVQDLAGKTVSVGAGSVSEHWVAGYNETVDNKTPERRIRIQAQDSLAQGCDALLAGQVDAVIADNGQIQYYLSKVKPRVPLRVALSNIHRQSQGLIFSPGLPSETALRINQAIARLRENGTIDTIKKRWQKDD